MLANLVMSALAMAVGALAPSNAVANAAGSLVTLFALLFAGYLLAVAQGTDGVAAAVRAALDARDAPRALWAVMAALSPLRCAYGALVVNEFAGLEGLRITTVLGSGTETSPPFSGEDMLRCFGFAPDQLGDDVAALVAMLGASLALVFLLLRFVVREKR